MPKITDDCMSCGMCQEACPKGAIVPKYGNKYMRMSIDQELCIGCGACLTIGCPGDAIKREVAG